MATTKGDPERYVKLIPEEWFLDEEDRRRELLFVDRLLFSLETGPDMDVLSFDFRTRLQAVYYLPTMAEDFNRVLANVNVDGPCNRVEPRLAVALQET